MNRKVVILINTGTPDSPKVGDVRRYLREFLGDGRVISIPTIPRMLLVHGIIAPFRAPKSAKLYQKVWTKNGSPLLWHSENLKIKLQEALGKQYEVILGMRYGNPSLKSALDHAIRNKISEIILFPLFPQYASSTTGSAIDFAFRFLKKQTVIPQVRVAGQFFNDPDYIDSFAQKILEKNPRRFDHILFTYHSLPISHVNATHFGKPCSHYNCTNEIDSLNNFCYHATCYATTRYLAKKLNLAPGHFSVAFQSRFARKWLGPFSDDVIKQKAQEGVKKLLVVSPSFVTDCLETIVELGMDYRDLFLENGGKIYQWVESLNDSSQWVQTLCRIIKNQ